MSYVSKENLEGANKYKCGSCGKLVNAVKVCICMKIFQSKPSLLYVAQTGAGQLGGIWDKVKFFKRHIAINP